MSKPSFQAVLSAGIFLTVVRIAAGQIQPPTPQEAPATATAPAGIHVEAGNPGSMGVGADTQSAESVLQNLLKDKGNAEGPAATSPALGNDGLLREGLSVYYRSGRLKKDPDTHAVLFVFDNKPDEPPYPPMSVLPTRWLQTMEDVSNYGATPMTFRIVADVTQYHGKNYLYLGPAGSAAPASTEMPPVSTAPAATSTAPAADADQPLIRAVAPNAPTDSPLVDPQVITMRVARLTKDAQTGNEVLVFDADGKKMTDPPMGVLACSLLTVMENASENGTKPTKFQVSGSVTQYRGKNYLYLRNVKIVKDLHTGLAG